VHVFAVLALASSGCALAASAFTSHNSYGTACVDSPAFGVIDLIIAGTAAGGMAIGDASPGYYAIPGVFGVSGLVGIAFAARCAGMHDGERTTAMPATNTAPSFGDAPVDPTLRDATPADRGSPAVPPATPATLHLDRNGIPTTLPPVPPTAAPVPPTAAPVPPGAAPVPPTKPAISPTTPAEPAAPTCRISPREDCPEHYYCQLEHENQGVCVRMP
jgi:hypothetical protein